ncbi:MAG: AraC family transcriptional regulator [Lachnospiraceae bacterium]|nr:AraC family transcriptional regulator [Lachnospiraceae bacterium]
MTATRIDIDDNSKRIIYTPSHFAKDNLLYLQETGTLKATSAFESCRSHMNSYLFFYVISGSGHVKCNGHTYTLKEKECAFINCQQPYCHYTSNKDPWEISWIHFNGPTVANIFNRYVEKGGKPVFAPDKIIPFSRIVDRIYLIASSKEHSRDMNINAALAELLANIMEYSRPNKAYVASTSATYNVPIIKRYIDEHFVEDLSLATLSDHFDINKYQLAKVFKQEYDLSVGNYIKYQRITKAKSMLRFTNEKIEDIGGNCGIPDPNYFSRLFKQFEGISPGEYRKKWKA